MNNLYEVQEFTLCDGWVNTWTHEQDGSHAPTRFTSREGAQAELDYFFEDMADAVANGYMEDVPERDTFRIVEIPLTFENTISRDVWQQGLNDEYASQAQFEELLK